MNKDGVITPRLFFCNSKLYTYFHQNLNIFIIDIAAVLITRMPYSCRSSLAASLTVSGLSLLDRSVSKI